MQRRQFLRGAAGLVGTAALAPSALATPRPWTIERINTATPGKPPPFDEADGGYFPVLGLGEWGSRVLDASFLAGAPPTDYWRLAPAGARALSNAGTRGTRGNRTGGPLRKGPEAGPGRLQERLQNAPLALLIGDPAEAAVQALLPGLERTFAQAGGRSVWIRPPGSETTATPGLPGGGVLAFQEAGGGREPHPNGHRSGPAAARAHYQRALWCLEGSVATAEPPAIEPFLLADTLTGQHALAAASLSAPTEGAREAMANALQRLEGPLNSPGAQVESVYARVRPSPTGLPTESRSAFRSLIEELRVAGHRRFARDLAEAQVPLPLARTGPRAGGKASAALFCSLG